MLLSIHNNIFRFLIRIFINIRSYYIILFIATSGVIHAQSKSLKPYDSFTVAHNIDTMSSFLLYNLRHSIQKGNHDSIIYFSYELGRTYDAKNQTDSSLYYYQITIDHSGKSDHYQSFARSAYNNIGSVYYFKGDYSTALKYYDSFLTEELTINPNAANQNLAITFNNIGGIHQQLKQQAKALHFFSKAEAICRNNNFRQQLAYTLGNKAEVYNSLNKDEVAEQLYKESISLSLALKERDGTHLIAVHSGYAQLKLKQKQPDAALTLLHKIGELDKSYYKQYSSITPNYLRGLAYIQKGNFHLAFKYLNNAKRESLQLNIGDNLIDIYKALAQVEDSLGNYKMALTYFYKYEQLKDSLLGREKARDINEIDAKYRTAEKDRELAEQKLRVANQQVQLQRRNNWIWIAGLSILLLGSVSLLNYRNSRNKQNILRDKLSILEQNQEIKLLKASIVGEEQERIRIGKELHDGIGGLLSAVKLQLDSLRLKNAAIAEERDLVKAIDLVDEATGEIRKTAHNLIPEILLRNGITSAIAQFCHRIASSNGPDIKVQIYGPIPRMEATTELSLYRTIQELVNNALKHAKASEIIVQLNWKEEDNFHIAIEDNGIGLPADSLKSQHGLGLGNIISRVEAMGGIMEIESIPSTGTCIYIDFEAGKLEQINSGIL